MAGKRITTELVIKGVDQYTSMLRNMTGETGRFAAKVRGQMGQLQGLRGSLLLIKDFDKLREKSKASGVALETAREKLRKLEYQFKTARKPTQAMYREIERARGSVDRLSDSHRRNRKALDASFNGLRKAGVNTANLVGEQRRLTGALGSASSAFGTQVIRMQRLKVMQDRIAESRKIMDRSLARSANLNFVGTASMMTGRRMLSGLSKPVMQAVEFESAMSDVRKVVDFESPAAFKAMSADILEMSTRIPVAASGLAEIVAAGGQSGIAQGELAQFAEMAAKIGVAFDLSAGSVGTSMAKIKTAFRLDLEQTGSLFDAMNHLSNNSAARAEQTLSFLNRAGADGENFGFDQTETLAIGASMIAAGAGADTAATSFRNMGRALTKGESATKRQHTAYSLLGLEAEDVARRMQIDAVGTTQDVLGRLNKLPDHLRASTISNLFGDEARELTKLLNNMELMPQMLAMVADETQYLGSAEAEFAERAKTTANNLQLLRNETTRLGVSIGEVMLPPLNAFLVKSRRLVAQLVTWTKAHPNLTKWLVVSGVALGGMAVAGGAMLSAAAGLIGTLAVLRFGLSGLGARAFFASGGVGRVGKGFIKLRRLPKFALSSLIKPLRWTARLLPAISWGALLTRSGKFGMNATGWGRLITPLKWFGRGALRFIPVIGWAVMAGDIGLFAWKHLGLKELPWGDYLKKSIEWKDRFFNFEWSDFLPIWSWGFIKVVDLTGLIKWPEPPEWLQWMMGRQEEAAGFPLSRNLPGVETIDPVVRKAAQTVHGVAGQENLPTPARLQGLRSLAQNIRAEITELQLELDGLDVPADAYAPASPEYQKAKSQMEARLADLALVEKSLAEDELAAKSLSNALGVLSGTNVTPEISTESIDRALEQVEKLADELRNIPIASGVHTPIGAAREVTPLVTPLAGGRAAGGPMTPGAPYLAGERGAEPIFASRGAFVATHQQMNKLQNLGANLTPTVQFKRPSSANRTMLTRRGPAREITPLAGARAAGGSMTPGLPYLTGERGPEPVFASRAAFLGTNERMQKMQRSSQRLRAAGLAALASSVMVATPMAAASNAIAGEHPSVASPPAGDRSPGGDPTRAGDRLPAGNRPPVGDRPPAGGASIRVDIDSIHIVAPAGVSDPEGLVDLLETRLGERLAATLAASFSD